MSHPGSTSVRFRFWGWVWLGVILPLTLCFVAYFGFITGFTYHSFTPGSFLWQFGTGIFRYRVLGRELVLQVRELIDGIATSRGWQWELLFEDAHRMMLFLDEPKGDFSLYLALVVVNTGSTLLCSTLIWMWLVHPKSLLPSRQGQMAWSLATTALLVLTQYVVVPYDLLSYVFLLTGMWCWRQWMGTRARSWLSGFLVMVVLGTLTRESTLLLLSFALAWAVVSGIRAHVIPLALGSGAFAGTYLALRQYLGWQPGVWAGAQWTQNFGSFSGWMGLLFGGSLAFVLYHLAHQRQQRLRLGWFMVFAAPYLFLVLYTGLVFEYRLWMPLLLAAFGLLHVPTEPGSTLKRR